MINYYVINVAQNSLFFCQSDSIREPRWRNIFSQLSLAGRKIAFIWQACLLNQILPLNIEILYTATVVYAPIIKDLYYNYSKI